MKKANFMIILSLTSLLLIQMVFAECYMQEEVTKGSRCYQSNYKERCIPCDIDENIFFPCGNNMPNMPTRCLSCGSGDYVAGLKVDISESSEGYLSKITTTVFNEKCCQSNLNTYSVGSIKRYKETEYSTSNIDRTCCQKTQVACQQTYVGATETTTKGACCDLKTQACTYPKDPHKTPGIQLECVSSETECNDGWDNDGDGVTDCGDKDCEGKVITMPPETPGENPICGVCIRTTQLRDIVCCGVIGENGIPIPDAEGRLFNKRGGTISSLLTDTGARLSPTVVCSKIKLGDKTAVPINYDRYCYAGAWTPNSAPIIERDEVTCTKQLDIEVKGNGNAGDINIPEKIREKLQLKNIALKRIYYIRPPERTDWAETALTPPEHFWTGFESAGIDTHFFDGGKCSLKTPPPEGREETSEANLKCNLTRIETQERGLTSPEVITKGVLLNTNEDCSLIKLNRYAKTNFPWPSDYVGYENYFFSEDHLMRAEVGMEKKGYISVDGGVQVDNMMGDSFFVMDDGTVEQGKCSGNNLKMSQRSSGLLVCPGGRRDVGNLKLDIIVSVLLFGKQAEAYADIQDIHVIIDPHLKYCGIPQFTSRLKFMIDWILIEKAKEEIKKLGETIDAESLSRINLVQFLNENVGEEVISKILNAKYIDFSSDASVKENYLTLSMSGKACSGWLKTGCYIVDIKDKKICINAAGGINKADSVLSNFNEFAGVQSVNLFNIIQVDVNKDFKLSYNLNNFLNALQCCPFSEDVCSDETKKALNGNGEISTKSNSFYFVYAGNFDSREIVTKIYRVSPETNFLSQVKVNLEYPKKNSSKGEYELQEIVKLSEDYIKNKNIAYVKQNAVVFEANISGGKFYSKDKNFSINITQNSVTNKLNMEIAEVIFPDTFKPEIECQIGTDCQTQMVGQPYCYQGYVVQNESLPNCINPGSYSSYCSSKLSYPQILEICGENQVCQNAQCVVPSCTSDSDGSNMENKGYVETNYGRIEDECLNPFSLIEYTCQNSKVIKNGHNCPGLCDEGRCVQLFPDKNADDSVNMDEMLNYFDDYYSGKISKENLMAGYWQWNLK